MLGSSPKVLSFSMQIVLKNLHKHIPSIVNTFNYTFSNSSLKGSINKIKVIKNLTYGLEFFEILDAVLQSVLIKVKLSKLIKE